MRAADSDAVSDRPFESRMKSPFEPVRLLDELRQRRRDLLRAVGPGAVVTILAFLVAFYFVEPPPPDSVVIATGMTGGRYFAWAEAYAKVFERNGIKLELRQTAGSIENFELLLHDESVSLALVQGGTAPPEAKSSGNIEAIGSVYFEPLWVFHRTREPVKSLADVKGKRIAVGETGSGSLSLSMQVLSTNGVRDGEHGTTFLRHGANDAASALKADEIDIAMFVSGPEAPVIRELLGDSEIELMDFARQKAYERRFPFLKGIILEQGVIDIERDLPRKRTRMIAPAANLVATTSLHQAFIPLILEAALEQHNDGGILADDGELPTLEFVSLPANATARRYLDHGPSFFQRHLSFWLASLFDRAKILIIPLITLLFPLLKLAPPVYRWRIRSRIYRWYSVLRHIDQEVQQNAETDVSRHLETLQAMSKELDSVQVPLSYMVEFYNLRMHIRLVQDELNRLTVDHAPIPSPAPDTTVSGAPASDVTAGESRADNT